MAPEILKIACYTITIDGQIASAAKLLSTIVAAGSQKDCPNALPALK